MTGNYQYLTVSTAFSALMSRKSPNTIRKYRLFGSIIIINVLIQVVLSCRNITGVCKLQHTKCRQVVAGLVTKGRPEQFSLQVAENGISNVHFC